MKRNTLISLRLVAVVVTVLFVVAACKKSFLDQETIGLLTEKEAAGGVSLHIGRQTT